MFTWPAFTPMSPGRPETGRRDPPPDEDEQLWEAVADSSRRKVLDLILAHGQATPTMLAADLPFTRQAVAKHLVVLARAGLIEGHRHGREVRYTVRPERLSVAAQAMATAAAQWDARLHAIKRLAEDLTRTTAPGPSPEEASPEGSSAE